MSSPEDRSDALYGLPLDRFVAERNALAKALRADGDRAGAERVRRLAKPSRAAWALNVTVREHPGEARALTEAARLLADAQRELLTGGHPSVLREASDQARAAIEALVAVAPLTGDATAERLRETLHAAIVDPDILAEVATGRVVHERVASGFGGLAALAAAGPTPRSARPRKGRAAASPVAETARRKTVPPRAGRSTAGEQSTSDRQRPSAAASREQSRRREKLRRAKEAEAAAENDLDAARGALEQVRSALADRRRQVREAESRLRDARRHRERAER